MKHLILCAIACLFLCTACFEKDKEVEEIEVEVVPPKFNILECERIQTFVNGVPNGEPRKPRATVKKYLKGDQPIFETHTGGAFGYDHVVIAYWNTECKIVCNITRGIIADKPCSQSFLDSLVYIETVWIDER